MRTNSNSEKKSKLEGMKSLYSIFHHSFKIDHKSVQKEKKLSGILGGVTSFYLFDYFIELCSKDELCNIVYLTTDDLRASKIFEELNFLTASLAGDNSFNAVSKADILYFPSWGILPFTYSRPDTRKEGERARTLSSLLSGNKKRIIITSVDAVVQKIPEKKSYEEKCLLFQVHEKYIFSEIVSNLQFMGYEKTDIVQTYGEYCVKGNIIDIFPPLYFNPIRLDFFGDDLERIVLFDPDTQKSYSNLNQTSIFPRHDLILGDKELSTMREEIKNKAKNQDLTLPPFMQEKDFDSGGLWDFFPLVYKTSCFLEYFDKDTVLVSMDEEKIHERLVKIEDEIAFLRNRNEKKLMLEKDSLFINLSEFESLTSNSIWLSALSKTPQEQRLSVNHSPVYKGKISKFIEEMQSSVYKHKQIFVTAKSEIQIDRLKHIMSGYGAHLENLSIFEAPFEIGFDSEKFLLITEKDLFGKSSRLGKIQKNATQVIQSFTDLKTGDYVVHINYGIGQFKGLRRMQVAGFERDFIEIEYAEANKLYVPIEQLHFVHKYIGSSDRPTLDYLGKKSGWSKTKSKVKESIEKMAAELLELYARREKSVGIIFPPDSRFQEEFEASFPFEETEHQLEAINEVKKDMENEKPMDRLVCGDVGFGKTEVAIRAAFKAVMAGKQVCILCPTTILAFQHFNTFKKRFEGYPVKIEMMSRFRTPSELLKTQEGITSGNVDVVVGTHAVLSRSIVWKNLGLLVVDEEQRFGVKQKEHIKNLRANVDCLTMTATPIPRTLQMSLIGIRDLSIIETPPRNRLKIETYVLEENDELLRRAIKTEIDRHGQVIILHNKVQTIDARAAAIKNIVPFAEILVMHGQMTEDEIEERMMDFYNKNYNVLISTTIIESGIDLPDANTLIVLNSQNFGLSQLYQIKGRVGRSDRQAYAYFFYPPGLSVTEKAEKRLNTLMEYDGLGDGFKIAMKDLEIRGAGNILGKEQSGDIMAVGFELYINMLHEKLSELKNEVRSEDMECNVIIPQDYFIPDDYIIDVRQKMEFYKKLTSVSGLEEIEDLMTEMNDRFGPMPETVESICLQEKLRLIGKILKFEKIVLQESLLFLVASPQMSEAIDKIIGLIKKDKRFSLDPADPRKMVFQGGGGKISDILRAINSILEYLI